MGHFVDQGAGEPEVPPAAVGGVAPGQGDLAAQSLAAFGGGYAGGGFAGPAGGVEVGGQDGLFGGCGGLGAFEHGDAVDQRRLIHRVEHVFDDTPPHRQAASPQTGHQSEADLLGVIPISDQFLGQHLFLVDDPDAQREERRDISARPQYESSASGVPTIMTSAPKYIG